MSQMLESIRGVTKQDKYLCFVLCMILLGVYLWSRDSTVATLLTAAIGAMLNILRGAND